MSIEIREKYGLNWKKHDDLQIELSMIRHGGYWTIEGQKCGLGLLEHFLRARELVWPDRYRHRWTDQMYNEFINNIVTILMGAGSTQKTSHGSEFVLLDYWANYTNTLVLVSTTTVDKLDLAVFGELTMLHKAGQERWRWLPGNRLASKRAITTDNLEAEGTRDIRKGIIGRPCFLTGTLVDTPSGKVPIERLKVGDQVYNAIGIGSVRETMSHQSIDLVRVHLSRGRTIDCTPGHPFFTHMGWVKAIDLSSHHIVLSARETMQILRSRTARKGVSSLLQPTLQDSEQDQKMSGVPAKSHPIGLSERHLFQALYDEIEDERSELRDQDKSQGGSGGYGQEGEQFSDEESGREEKEKPEDEAVEPSEVSRVVGSLRHWPHGSKGGENASRDVSGGYSQFCSSHRQEQQSSQGGTVVLLGSRVAINKAERGSRWLFPFQRSSETKRCETGPFSEGSRVDRIEVLKYSGDPGNERSGEGYTVHNIEVSGHPSYSVENCIVHNCYVGKQYVGLGTLAGIKQQRIRFLADELQFMASTFFDCLPNMFQSAGLDVEGQPEVKVIGSGNPKHDPFDMLSIAAEPVAGWDSVAGVEKTTAWDTKFHRGRCLNLIGTDSPNFDPPVGPIPRFPRLISQNTVNLVLKRWKKDSLQYYSQCLGKMVMGMAGNRVITKQLCEEHHAFDKATWRDAEFTHIGFLDPAWGGPNADRCVWGWLRYGTDLAGIQLIELMDMQVVPIMASTPKKDPDDQIAAFCKQEALFNNIEPSNIFYDSTGRGTTGSAFAGVFGTQVPVPVAFGDRPSQRAVRHDLYIQDTNGQKRLKRCDEEYGKRVTELWFAVRNVIECDQFRGLTEDVCREGCMREYTLVTGGRIDVETKEETRERMGESPDLFDALAVGVEGARQRGFKTQRLGREIIENEKPEDFFEEEAEQYQQMIQNQLLQH